MTPDFDQIAREIVNLGPLNGNLVAAQLRLIWNARGEADIAAIDAAWANAGCWSRGADGPDVRAQIRALDRG